MAKRSYFEELDEIESTWNDVQRSGIEVSQHLDPKWLSGNLFCIASGGSLSVAKFWQHVHEKYGLGIAKTLTPYEFFHTSSKPDIIALFSASGNNHDILQVFKIALSKGYRILVVTVSKNSKLLRYAKTNEPQSLSIYSLANCPKDGFLAVNSVVAMLGALSRLTADLFQFDLGIGSPVSQAKNDHLELMENGFPFSKIETFQIIVSEWGTPAGLDLESRLAESGLCNCFLTDARNFGHGRFIWIEKWKKSTLVVLINTPDSKKFINKFIKTLPDNHLVFHFDSPFWGILGAIYCTVRSILFFGDLARQRSVDPGKPEVPQWGKNIHKLYFTSNKSRIATAKHPLKKYPAMDTTFSAIACDFDGTLVDTRSRYGPLPELIIHQINRLLSEGLRFGVATGRGLSAYKELKECIDKNYHENVLVGLYNGSIIKKLSSDIEIFKTFWPIRDLISSIIKKVGSHNLKVSVKPTNISIRGGSVEKREIFAQKIIYELGPHARFIKKQASGHSVDIFPNCASKLLVVQGLIESPSTQVLCIGDQGQIGGNDEELLSWIPSISVGKKRPSSELCFWLGKDSQLRESSGTLKLLESIQKHGSSFRLNLDYN